MIPKIIHYCWLSEDPIPENLQRCMESWKKFLPDYEFMLWDRNRFDINSKKWTKQAFEAKKYAFAADYIRLYALYNYGGIYMDMDIEIVKNLDDLLLFPYILGFEREKKIEAGIMGFEKCNKYVKQCLDYYKDRLFCMKDGTMDTKPLPDIMYDILSVNYHIDKRKNIEIDFYDNDVYEIFPYEYLTAKSYETGQIKVTKNTYTIHHYAGSWLSKSGKIKNKIRELIHKNKFTYYLYKKIK